MQRQHLIRNRKAWKKRLNTPTPTPSSPSPILLPLPRVPGIMDPLIEFCTSLECSRTFQDAGVTANHLTHLLLTMQSWVDHHHHHDNDGNNDPRFVVKGLAYDLETLFEDIEVEHVAASPSSDPSFWSQLLSTQQHQIHQGFILSTTHRLVSIVKAIDQLVHEKIKPSSHYSMPPPNCVTVQNPVMVGNKCNSYYGLKQLLDKDVGDDHACVLRCNDCSQYVSYLKRGSPRCYVPFNHLKLPPSWRDFGFPWYLKVCVEFYNFACSTFPSRPSKETLILLWIAEGFVQQAHGTSLEDEASRYFDGLLRRGDIQNEFNNRFKTVADGFFCFGDSNGGDIPPHVWHVCIPCFSESHLETITNLPNSSEWLSLFVFSDNYSHLDPLLEDHFYDKFLLPSIVFLKLTNLRVLILNGVGLWIVPDYIFGLLHLRYLDLSNNPLKELPDLLVNLFRLQTLKVLQTHIKSLPKNLYRMTSLRHVCADSGVCCESIPPFIGRLFSLHTFEDFPVIRQHGCRISELKELNSLHGRLCIRQLENVTSFDEAQQARLHLKRHLTWLRLCWSESDIPDVNFDVLEFLQPHYNLQDLEIYGYLNATFPNWMSDPSFRNLGSVTLDECVCEELPAFGVLPCLKSLRISVVYGVKDICEKFYGHGKVKIGFPSLSTLYISFMHDLENWLGFNSGDLPKLEKLHISCCPELRNLPEMKNLNSLTELVIHECTKLNSLPKKGLPSNVKLLRIQNCPELAEKCDREVGGEWKKIAHIPSIHFWV